MLEGTENNQQRLVRDMMPRNLTNERITDHLKNCAIITSCGFSTTARTTLGARRFHTPPSTTRALYPGSSPPCCDGENTLRRSPRIRAFGWAPIPHSGVRPRHPSCLCIECAVAKTRIRQVLRVNRELQQQQRFHRENELVWNHSPVAVRPSCLALPCSLCHAMYRPIAE